MSLNFLTRKLKTQKLEENNENEETSSAGQATMNEAEVRHYFVVLTFKLTLWDILVLIDFHTFSGGSTSK